MKINAKIKTIQITGLFVIFVNFCALLFFVKGHSQVVEYCFLAITVS